MSGKYWRSHSQLIILALLLLVAAVCIMSTEAFARIEARYLMRAGDVVFGNDLYNSRSIQTLFHQQSLNVSDIEHYDMAFPLFADGLGLGPTIIGAGATVDGVDFGAGGTSNVLPFGLVNLAFPSIHEDVSQSVSATQTGFFASNYNYRPEEDWGNVPLTTNYPAAVRQAITPAPLFGLTPLYPEQYDTWWINNRLKELNQTKPASTAPANQTTSNRTASNQTLLNQPPSDQSLSNQTIRALGIPLSSNLTNTTVSGQIKAQDLKPALAIEYFKPKNASTKPWDMPVVYPGIFNLAGKDYPVYPNPGIGTFSTNGAGSTGASLTGPPVTAKPVSLAGNQIGNQTRTGNVTGNQTAQAGMQSVKPTISPPAGNGLTYADFNFSATTEQINSMPILERMWRNSHRGGQMGKAYIGDTSTPYWIDPYERPYDLPMIDEHCYVLQSALNMVVPGTQIMPRFWSLGIV
jgi:hypothetical protein